jgi:hypothetical protein
MTGSADRARQLGSDPDSLDSLPPVLHPPGYRWRDNRPGSAAACGRAAVRPSVPATISRHQRHPLVPPGPKGIRIDRDDRLPGTGRVALVVKERARLPGVVRAGQPGAEKLHHQRQRCALGVARAESWFPPSPPLASVVGWPSGSSAQPSGIASPFCAAAMILPRATFDSEISTTTGSSIAKRSGKGDRIGAEQRPPPAPGRHRRWRIGHHQRRDATLGQCLDNHAGNPAMVRAADTGNRDALRLLQPGAAIQAPGPLPDRQSRWPHRSPSHRAGFLDVGTLQTRPPCPPVPAPSRPRPAAARGRICPASSAASSALRHRQCIGRGGTAAHQGATDQVGDRLGRHGFSVRSCLAPSASSTLSAIRWLTRSLDSPVTPQYAGSGSDWATRLEFGTLLPQLSGSVSNTSSAAPPIRPGLQGFRQGGLVNNTAARRIDQHRIRISFCEAHPH